MMEGGKRDALVEWALGMFGLAGGAAPSAIPALVKGYSTNPPMPIEGGDMIQIAMMLVGLSVGLAASIAAGVRGKKASDIFAEIRKQKP